MEQRARFMLFQGRDTLGSEYPPGAQNNDGGHPQGPLCRFGEACDL